MESDGAVSRGTWIERVITAENPDGFEAQYSNLVVTEGYKGTQDRPEEKEQ